MLQFPIVRKPTQCHADAQFRRTFQHSEAHQRRFAKWLRIIIGVRVAEINDGTRSITTVSTAIVGMVCTSRRRRCINIPLNTPVLLTDVLTASGKAGESGTLARSLDAIADQTKPVTVVVRVAQGETEAETRRISSVV
jgi:phage tail sheath protein FI